MQSVLWELYSTRKPKIDVRNSFCWDCTYHSQCTTLAGEYRDTSLNKFYGINCAVESRVISSFRAQLKALFSRLEPGLAHRPPPRKVP
eukprot:1180921-Amphidinium_carterae.1